MAEREILLGIEADEEPRQGKTDPQRTVVMNLRDRETRQGAQVTFRGRAEVFALIRELGAVAKGAVDDVRCVLPGIELEVTR